MYQKPINFYPIIDNWFTINIYSGYSYLDRFLITIKPIINEFKEKKIIKKFFFIRYRDYDSHLRLRFFIEDINSIIIVYEDFKKILNEDFENYFVWNITITGYEREILRYGNLSIELIEDIFDHCSNFVINKIDQYQDRWKLGLIMFTVFLDSLEFDTKEKQKFCRKICNSFLSEYSFSKETRKILGERGKLYENEFSTILDNNSLDYLELKKNLTLSCFKLKGILSFYSQEFATSLISSVIHMNFNRVFINNARTNEALLYYLLDKYYTKLIFRG